MGKVLVIKGKDFSKNAISKIAIADPTDITSMAFNGYLNGGYLYVLSENPDDGISKTYIIPTKTGYRGGLFTLRDKVEITIPAGYRFRLVFNNTSTGIVEKPNVKYNIRAEIVTVTNQNMVVETKDLLGIIGETYPAAFPYWSLNISRNSSGELTLDELIKNGFKVKMLNLSALFWEPTAFGSCISEDGSETEDSKIDSMLFRLTPGRTYSVTQQSEGLNARIFVRNEDTLTQDSVFTNYQFNYTCPEDGSQRVMQLIREVDNENPIPFVSVY